MTTRNMIEAINDAHRVMMARDPDIVVFGEDVGYFGGVFRATAGLQKEFGKTRCFDAPISEGGIVGTAVGMAAYGLKPVIEIQFADYIYPGYDQIVSEVARIRYRTAGEWTMPTVIRSPYGGGIFGGQTHSQSPESLFTHIAGIKTVIPSNPYDAKGLLIAAIEDDDPVVFFEPKRLYHSRFEGERGEVDLEADIADAPPMGLARVVREGADVTLVTYGAQVTTALDAAVAAEDDGVSIEVIDLRSLSPVDYRTLSASVRKTGRLVVTHEAGGEAGVAAEIITSLTEQCFHHLESAPVRVTGHDIPYPPAKLERHHIPDLDRILDGVDRALDRPNSLSGVTL